MASRKASRSPTGPVCTASVQGHMAENDDFFSPDAARALEEKLRAMGKDVTFTVHPGTGHAFMGPHNALGTLDEELAARDLARGRRVPAREAGLIAVPRPRLPRTLHLR